MAGILIIRRFCDLNGIKFNEEGDIVPLPEALSGRNCFLLPPVALLHCHDPHRKLVTQQLNGACLPAQKRLGIDSSLFEENENCSI
jgi:hypothetical protein